MGPTDLRSVPVTSTDDAGMFTRTPVRLDHPPTVFRDPAYQNVVDQIRGLAKLPEGWDSYGAKRVEPGAQANAVRFVTMLETHIDAPVPPPIVGPSAEGGVILRWEVQGKEVVVKLLDKGGEYYVARGDEDKLVAEGDVGRLEGLVARLVEFLTP